jgi:hypothetical protein
MAIEPPPDLKIGGTSGKPPVKIVDPGASWRRFYRASPTMKTMIAIFPLSTDDKGFFVPAGDLVKA